MYPAIFLDRDGVLIENRSDYIRDWSQVRIFSKALEALSLSIIKKYKVVIITNQSGIGRNLIPLKTAQKINQKLVEVIKDNGGQIAGVYMCPHRPEEQCACRKPRPGLIWQAARELSLDLQHSWVIGDAWSDLLAGKAAGIDRVIIVKTGRGAEQLRQPSPEDIDSYLVFNDLSDALDGIFRIDHGEDKEFSS
jgi:D-glycero-D-manno-heptose 1,7-bisphosphate phosphatase